MTTVRTISGSRPLALLGAAVLAVLFGSTASAAPLAIADVPVFLNRRTRNRWSCWLCLNDEALLPQGLYDFA